MANYRLLAPHYIGTRYFEAGEVVSDTGAGALLPAGWPPTLGCDPLDADAIQKLWDVGPGLVAGARSWLALGYWGQQGGRWTGGVGPPLIYWQAFDDEGRWILTGAGASLGVKRVVSGPMVETAPPHEGVERFANTNL